VDPHIDQTSRKRLDKHLPARKLMATVFWNRGEVLIVEFIQQGSIITSEVKFGTLLNLRTAIQNKRRGMLAYGVVLVHLHDNARPHKAARTRALLEHFTWELFDHPPYSPDLAPRDYHLFTCMKN
jgi:hypothetical protein